MTQIDVLPGKPLPFGATPNRLGVNFSVFSRNGTSVTLDIFDSEDDSTPSFSYTLDPEINRTGDIWHVCLTGLKPGALYLYRVDGPFDPKKGHRFNKNQYLIDPYTKALTATSIFENLPKHYKTPVDKLDIEMDHLRSAKGFPKCVVIDDEDFDWQGDSPLNYRLQDCIIYETHVKGFTASPSSEVMYPGTYRGLIEKIPYLKQLGITSVELLPIQEFDEYENANTNPRTGERLKNHWGYSTIAFFAPKATYASQQDPGYAVREFKEMVRELHKNGIEVILDIVFNHTAEGNEHGLTLNFRGFDNSIYYILDDKQKQYYKNFSGCGNTVNCNHPVVRSFIVDCLRYWVTEMHVDGFRFDLASILGRDKNGDLISEPPVLLRISEDPVLSKTKIIAEAWDAGGAYQVGNFPGRWAEWNDRFRDDIRRFWKGDDNLEAAVATRFAGSADLYQDDGRRPYHSINFITSHDGFTLNDLVSYNGKHNDENGENNRDGSDNNSSYNYGFEGPTQNSVIEEIRNRQIKNMMLSLILSQGTPMLLSGDEIRRSQKGNNNAYCQDNELSWFNWAIKDDNKEIFDFTCKTIQAKKLHAIFRRKTFFNGRSHNVSAIPDISWFGRDGKEIQWDKADHFVAYRLSGNRTETQEVSDDWDFFVMCNASIKDISVVLPSPNKGKKWYRYVDTSVAAPGDFLPENGLESLPNQRVYVLPARSTAILAGK